MTDDVSKRLEYLERQYAEILRRLEKLEALVGDVETAAAQIPA